MADQNVKADSADVIPVFGFEDGLFLAGLATKEMLGHERRAPAPDQKPAARYWSGHDWVMLWKTDDAVAKPALSPGRAQRWNLNRTCARCSATSKRGPFTVGVDGKRYCWPCQEPAAEAHWEAGCAAERPALTEWAAGVLANPDRAVLVAQRWRGAGWGVDLLAVSLTGEVIVDATILCREESRQHVPEAESDSALLIHEISTQLDRLDGRRLIAWWPTTSLGSLSVEGFDWAGLQTAAGDFFGTHWRKWVGKAKGSYLHPYPAETPPPHAAADQIEAMRDGLAEMASGTKTSGSPGKIPGPGA